MTSKKYPECNGSKNVLILVGICISVAFCINGPRLLADVAVPALENYINEEKYHVTGLCERVNVTSAAHVNYCQQRGCWDVETDTNCTSAIQACYTVTVQLTINDTIHTAQLFKSYKDAIYTDFTCLVPGCPDRNLNQVLMELTNHSRSFTCYYSYKQFKYVYLETANQIEVIATLVLTLVMTMVGLWGLLLCGGMITGAKAFTRVLLCGCCCGFSLNNKVWNREIEERKRILDAIDSGHISRVKEVVNTNNVNMQLNTKEVFQIRVTSPLSQSASLGCVGIMEYLLSVNADQNYLNDAKQTVLHCACLSRMPEAVQFCIDSITYCRDWVNLRDRHGNTPLLTLTNSAQELIKIQVVKCARILIEAGANTTVIDNNRCSALHHAILSSNHRLVSLLIQSGCINNSPHVDGSRTPMAALLLLRDYSNILLLIEAGACLQKDRQVMQIMSTVSGLNEQICAIVHHELQNPVPLLRACRTAIRVQMKGVRTQQRLAALTYSNGAKLPDGFIRFLQLDTCNLNVQ